MSHLLNSYECPEYEQGLMSRSTHYRSFRRRWKKCPDKQCWRAFRRYQHRCFKRA